MPWIRHYVVAGLPGGISQPSAARRALFDPASKPGVIWMTASLPDKSVTDISCSNDFF
jgi:hypothetical protein